MPKALSTGPANTAISGAKPATVTLPVLNYGIDWGVIENTAGQAAITNTKSSISAPRRLRFGQSKIADVYKNTGIDRALMQPSHNGTSILCQFTDTFSIIDTTDTKYEVLLPVSAHLVLKVPNNDLLTPSVILDSIICPMLAGLFEPGSNDPARIVAMLRGALLPTAM